MMRALWTAATGMMAQQMNVDVIANNLANVNTVGFKKSRADFEDLLYQSMRQAGANAAQGAQIPTGIEVGLGTHPVSIQKLFDQGTFEQTSNKLDLSIQGDGFFRVLMPDGTTGYTRDGSFKMDGQGRMVNSSGYALDPEILIPADVKDITIGSDGTVSVQRAGQQDYEQIGQIRLTRFVNPAGLSSLGQNIFKPNAASGEPNEGTPGQEGFGSIGQGILEMSNVKIVEEMVNMIVAQRAYEVNSKAIQTADDMLNTANNLRR
ncbi:MAG: flagellar basal-body rod protein FlgG [Armatimonadetes bacterium]|nr:flagellar basal-body rod protein FlgG [Armatimonadota bacterium]